MLKKFLTIFLALIMAFSLGACGGETPSNNNGDIPPALTETEKYTQKSPILHNFSLLFTTFEDSGRYNCRQSRDVFQGSVTELSE